MSITSKIHSTGDFIELLGLQEISWEQVKGAHGYKSRLYWNCISIHYDGTEDMGIWLELTGQGCRAFETYGTGNYEALFSEVLYNEGQMKITRLDVAYDDIDEEIIDMSVLRRDTEALEFVSKFNKWDARIGSDGASVEHGSKKSDVFLRIYDKAMERGFKDGRHWIRIEFQLRDDRALSFILMPGDIGLKFSGVLANYLRYVDLPDVSDSNRWRWPMKCYWSRLLAGAARIKLYEKPGTDYNLCNLEEFVYRQAGNAVSALLQIVGDDEFKARLKERGTVQNPKYKALIDEYCNSK